MDFVETLNPSLTPFTSVKIYPGVKFTPGKGSSTISGDLIVSSGYPVIASTNFTLPTGFFEGNVGHLYQIRLLKDDTSESNFKFYFKIGNHHKDISPDYLVHTTGDTVSDGVLDSPISEIFGLRQITNANKAPSTQDWQYPGYGIKFATNYFNPSIAGKDPELGFYKRVEDYTHGDTWLFSDSNASGRDITKYLVNCSQFSFQGGSVTDQFTYLGNTLQIELLKSIENDNLFDPEYDFNLFYLQNWGKEGYRAKIEVTTGFEEGGEDITFIGFIENIIEKGDTVVLELGDGIYKTKEVYAHDIGILEEKRDLRQVGEVVSEMIASEVKRAKAEDLTYTAALNETKFETYFKPIVKGFAGQRLIISPTNKDTETSLTDGQYEAEIVNNLNFSGKLNSKKAIVDYNKGLVQFETPPIKKSEGNTTSLAEGTVYLTFKHAYKWKHPSFYARKLFKKLGYTIDESRFETEYVESDEGRVFSRNGRIFTNTGDRTKEVNYSICYVEEDPVTRYQNGGNISDIGDSFYFGVGNRLVQHNVQTGEEIVVYESAPNRCIYKVLTSKVSSIVNLVWFEADNAQVSKDSVNTTIVDGFTGGNVQIHRIILTTSIGVSSFETLDGGSNVVFSTPTNTNILYYKEANPSTSKQIGKEFSFREDFGFDFNYTVVGAPGNKEYSNQAYLNGNNLYFVFQYKSLFDYKLINDSTLRKSTALSAPDWDVLDSRDEVTRKRIGDYNYLIKLDVTNSPTIGADDQVLTGTLRTTYTSKSVIGTLTKFQTDPQASKRVAAGDRIRVNSIQRTVDSVSSDTALQVTDEFPISGSDTSAIKIGTQIEDIHLKTNTAGNHSAGDVDQNFIFLEFNNVNHGLSATQFVILSNTTKDNQFDGLWKVIEVSPSSFPGNQFVKLELEDDNYKKNPNTGILITDKDGVDVTFSGKTVANSGDNISRKFKAFGNGLRSVQGSTTTSGNSALDPSIKYFNLNNYNHIESLTSKRKVFGYKVRGHQSKSVTSWEQAWGITTQNRIDFFVDDDGVYTVDVTANGGQSTNPEFADTTDQAKIRIRKWDSNLSVVWTIETSFKDVYTNFVSEPGVFNHGINSDKPEQFVTRRQYVPYDTWGLCKTDGLITVGTHWINRTSGFTTSVYDDFKSILVYRIDTETSSAITGAWLHESDTNQNLIQKVTETNSLTNTKNKSTPMFFIQRNLVQGTEDEETYDSLKEYPQYKKNEDFKKATYGLDLIDSDVLTFDTFRNEVRGKGELSVLPKKPIVWTDENNVKSIVYLGGNYGPYLTNAKMATEVNNNKNYVYRIFNLSDDPDVNKPDNLGELSDKKLYQLFPSENSHGRLIKFTARQQWNQTLAAYDSIEEVDWEYLGYSVVNSLDDTYKDFSSEIVIDKNDDLHFVVARSNRKFDIKNFDHFDSAHPLEAQPNKHTPLRYRLIGNPASLEQLDMNLNENQDNFMWVQYSKNLATKLPIVNTNDQYIYEVLKNLALITNFEFGIENEKPFFRKKISYKKLSSSLSSSSTTQVADFINQTGYHLVNKEVIRREDDVLHRGLFGSTASSAVIDTKIYPISLLAFEDNIVSINNYSLDYDYIYDEITGSFSFYSESLQRQINYKISEKAEYQDMFDRNLDLNIPYIADRNWANSIISRYVSLLSQKNYLMDIVLKYSPFLKSGENIAVKNVDFELDYDPFIVLSVSHDLSSFTTTAKARSIKSPLLTLEY